MASKVIVIGASMTSPRVARALADHTGEVVIVARDEIVGGARAPGPQQSASI